MLLTPTISRTLARALRPQALSSLTVTQKMFPAFRFADFHRAAAEFLKERTSVSEIRSVHHISLDQIANLPSGLFSSQAQHLHLNTCPMQLADVGYRKEESFPSDCFHVFRTGDGVSGVIRIRYLARAGVSVEVAVSRRGSEIEVLEELCRLSVQHSAYRNKLVQIDFPPEIRDEYGDVTGGQDLEISFRPDPAIGDDDIVFDPEIISVLERNVVRFHRMRDRLKQLGLPLQRGILLHGPPGTGKTFTCQYLYQRLQPVTMIVVSGRGLSQVKSICNFARTLQPSVVLLEDVDLIFSSREINLYSTGLGEMMDELDGFQRDDAVTFILTTNAIDRLEQAIKDRPGRISQCIYFGLPGRELRVRYLQRFLQPFSTNGLSIERVADISEGGSQAFLQELVNRAVQIAAESESDNSAVRLSTRHFEEAVDEMTRFTEDATESIIGFHQKQR